MLKTYGVFRYSLAGLRRAIGHPYRRSDPGPSEKHIGYLHDLLRWLGTRTIVAEKEYIDRDFLEDFAGYYVRCFSPYQKTCKRVHFFNTQFDAQQFEDFLVGATERNPESPGSAGLGNDLSSGYLGFVVVKPLPETIVGRTCLRPYPPDSRECEIPATREYEAHLFGFRLVTKTVAFQQQDKGVAHCATSALWSAFQVTGKLFQHSIPSQVEITQKAGEAALSETRALPSSGLNGRQMAEAIRQVGLEPHFVGGLNEYVLKSTLYAYLKAGLPVILGLHLENRAVQPARIEPARHSIAVCGFGLKKTEPIAYDDESGFLLRASRIDRFYAHDDELGPFAEFRFEPQEASLQTRAMLTSPYYPDIQFLPSFILVPLYHKIRIDMGFIEDHGVVPFDLVVVCGAEAGKIHLTERLEWDIFLTTVNDLKRDLIQSTGVQNGARRLEALVRSMPRFVWRATATMKDKPIVELIFDATDIEQGPLFVCAVEYDEAFSASLRGWIQEQRMASEPIPRPLKRILGWFAGKRKSRLA